LLAQLVLIGALTGVVVLVPSLSQSKKSGLENVFHQWLPNQNPACHTKLDQFFTQWFDTAYPTPNNATNKPQITGPGINGPDHFYDDNGACPRADQTITFDPLPNRSPSDPDFAVSATSDSGLPVSLAASGQCTVSGATVHLTGAGTCTITASQAGDLVFRPALPVAQMFVIGPGVTNDAPGGVASVQYSDSLNPTVTISASDDAALGSTFTAVATGLPAGLALAVDSISDDSTLPGTRTWTVTGATTAAPGAYPVTVTVTVGDGRHASTSFTLNVTAEDAGVTYTGDMLAFTSQGDSSASVLLRATVLDSSVVPSFGDAEPGDIRNGTVSFREGATVLCGPLPIDLLDDQATNGTASCTAALSLGAHQIDVYVNNYYTGTTSGLVEVTEPNGSFITGGGYQVIGTSGGAYAADSGSQMNFAFNVKYKNLKNFQGHVSVIFRKDGKTYQIKSTAINSLGIDASSGIANFRSKASLSDVTDPLAPISLGGNLTLQVTMTDAGEPGSNDTIGVTLWDGSKLLFSSEWTGAKTLEQLLGGGNLVVH
ncbi:MAG TPA: Ig domain-containing protein, partial [Anaerolineales bacterium]|nr:Ig domain-containing protein [Anaerolineales bacterium]